MNKKIINTDKAPAAIGPYVQAIKADKFLFVSGQIPLDPATMQKDGNDIKTQTKRVLENIKAIINQANGKLEDIVRCTVYLKDINDFAAMNEIYSQYFSN
jgi:2-iminobutanoate/2-iminopropanoate deaminase